MSTSKELAKDEPGIIEVLLLTFAPTTLQSTGTAHVASATLYLLPRPRLWERLEELLGSPPVGFASGFIDTLALCESPEPALLERWHGDAATSDDGERWTLCPTSKGLVAPVAFVGVDADSFCSLSQFSLDEVLAFFGIECTSVRFAPPESLGE